MNIANKFQAYMDLGRVQGVSSTVALCILGAYTSTYTPLPIDWLKFLIIGVFCHFAAASTNEYCDKELDSKVQELSNKPLVKGIISNKEALSFSIITTFAGIMFTIFFFPKLTAVLLSISSLGVIFAYNLIGKKTFLMCDFAPATAFALCVLFGVFAVGEPTTMSWIIVLFIFLYSIFGQWENGMKDADTDRLLGIQSIPALSGYSINKKLTIREPILLYGIVLKLLLYALYLLPLFLGIVTHKYIYIFLLIGLPSQIYVIYHLFGEHTRKDFVKIMLIDLISIWIMGISLLIDKIGLIGVIAFMLFTIIGYIIGSSMQKGAEFKLGGAKI